MKGFLNLQRPVFALTVASLAISTLLSSENAYSQTSQAGASIASSKIGLKVGSVVYVTADKLNVRSKPTLSPDAIVGQLLRNDQVQVIDLLKSSGNAVVKIRIVRSSNIDNSAASELYASADYLMSAAAPANTVSSGLSGASKYFIVQNIATERMRIYERCTTGPGCANKMVFETEMVVGRPEGEKGNKYALVTWLGRYKITDWVKFYQDAAENYPSWYDPEMPATPKPGSGGSAWMSKKVMPNGKGDMRGAFGWYAAMTAPNANSQWIHGTIGWGSDGDKFIKMTRNFLLNVFANPRSHGCTRLENRAVAYTRTLAPVGTEILRVYALEGLRDVTRARYQDQAQPKAWEFILTRDGVRKKGAPDSDKNSVLARGVTADLILEQGSYQVDQYPNALPLKKNAGWGTRIKGKSGNTYDINDDGFRGVFLIDEGTFVNYEHPAGLPKGGFEGPDVPASLQTSGDFTLSTEKIN